MSAEARERFFRSIAERIDADRVEEVHVFPAIRQGGRESGVAVVTLRPEAVESFEQPATPEDAIVSEEVAAPDVPDEQDAPGPSESVAAPEVVESFTLDELGGEPVDAPEPAPVRRFTVLRAHYLLTLKGPDRGKWEVGVVEEADAPAATVDEVVRGVHERAGGWGRGAEVPEHLTGDDFRAALVEEPWTATR